MEAWQARRLNTARAALDEFIERCDKEIAKIERQRAEAVKTRRQLSAIEDFREPRRARA